MCVIECGLMARESENFLWVQINFLLRARQPRHDDERSNDVEGVGGWMDCENKKK